METRRGKNSARREIASQRDLEAAEASALDKAHAFYQWLGGLNFSDVQMHQYLLECIGSFLVCQEEMAVRMKAALRRGDAASREVAQQWIDLDVLNTEWVSPRFCYAEETEASGPGT